MAQAGSYAQVNVDSRVLSLFGKNIATGAQDSFDVVLQKALDLRNKEYMRISGGHVSLTWYNVAESNRSLYINIPGTSLSNLRISIPASNYASVTHLCTVLQAAISSITGNAAVTLSYNQLTGFVSFVVDGSLLGLNPLAYNNNTMQITQQTDSLLNIGFPNIAVVSGVAPVVYNLGTYGSYSTSSPIFTFNSPGVAILGQTDMLLLCSKNFASMLVHNSNIAVQGSSDYSDVMHCVPVIESFEKFIIPPSPWMELATGGDRQLNTFDIQLRFPGRVPVMNLHGGYVFLQIEFGDSTHINAT
jgi:hypothetical protein